MKKTHLVAGALGIVAAVLYFASMADYAFPGESARLMACWRGIDVPEIPPYPLMAVFAAMFGAGNALAPVCGAIAAAAIFLLMAAFVGGRLRSEQTQQDKESLPLVAGIAATLVFMLSPAVRSAATHLEPRLFDFTWALLSFVLALSFMNRRDGLFWLFPPALGAMVALGFCDSAIFVAFLPFYLVLVAKAAVQSGKKPYMPLFLFALFAIAVAPLALWFFGVDVSEALKRTAAELRAYYRTPGWMFVAIFTTLPFVTALFSSAKAFNEKPGPVQCIFHGAMSFVSILAVATPLSPSALLEPYGILPVATSAFAAAVAGYLVAYWWMLRKTIVGIVAGGVLAFVLAVCCLWNLFAFDGDTGAFADKVARKVLADLGDRQWFISDGTLDSHLQLAAADEDRELHVVSLARDLDNDYLEKLSKVVEKTGLGGEKNSSLKLSVSLGVLPFVQDWFAADTNAAKEAAIYGAPDLWYSAGITPVPEFLFFGADESRVPDWSAWKEFDKILEAPKGWGSYHDRKVSNPVDRLRFSIRRHIGFVANNRGVWLQDKHRDDDAWKMYELVLNEIDHDNICAIFNEVAMVGAKHVAALSKKRDLERMLKSAVEDKRRRYILWRLGAYYGYIRDPAIFIRLGHTWARSGRPGEALSQIRRAIDFVPTDKRAVLMNMMAALYANENDQQESRRIYEAVLAKNAKDHDALIGLMRLELAAGNSAQALEYLQRAAAVNKDAKRANIENAMAAMMQNDAATARKLLRRAIDEDQSNMQAWSLLATVVMQQIDAAKGDNAAAAPLMKELETEILPAMEKRSDGAYDYYLQTTRGFLNLRQGQKNRKEARDAFLTAMKARPDVNTTQDLVLGLDISLDDKEGAETHARDVLRRNRNAPLANYVMGSIALNKGNLADAEAYLRRAASAPKPPPLALNDLAEVLRRVKNYKDAEAFARKATTAAPGLYVAWETLGSVLMDANRGLDEAEDCIRRACELSRTKGGRDTDVRMLMSLARVQIKRGDMQHAKVTIRKVQNRLDELSEFEKKEFEEIRKSAR
ncbi:MAG: tetratricopeptide repeat protein [Kiritimatiellae bacterium]|nr:tetratricopeptide repeat protein [Kiritimatiellia bacterium]